MAINYNQLTEQPECSTNLQKSDKEKKQRCAKPLPGATAGGCAFDGAQIVLLPVGDAAHLIHGPSTCCSQNWNNRGTRNIHGESFRRGFTTDVSEIDIVFGGEEKLTEAVLEISQKYDYKAVFVYSTCVTAMIGDDIEAACKKASEQVSIPVIPVESPGFIGNKNFGNKVAGESLFKYVIGTAEPEYTTDYDINIIGDYNIAGELWQMKPVFDELGIRVISSITGGASYDELRYAHRAKLSVVTCSRALVSLASKLNKEYGIPYIEGSFYGMSEISNTLFKIAEKLGKPELSRRIAEYVTRQEENVYSKIKGYIKEFRGKKVFVYTGGVKSWSTIYQLEELGFDVIGTSTRKSTEQDIEKIRTHFEGTQKMLLEKGDGKMLLGILEKENADILMAGGRNMYTAIKGRYPFVDVNQERIHGYAGYAGMVELAEQLYYTLNSPVWKVAKSTAPWES